MRDVRSTLKKTLVIIALGFAVIAGVDIYEYGLAKNLQQIVEANDQMQLQELEVQKMLAALSESDSAERTYLESRQSDALATYLHSRHEAWVSLDKIRFPRRSTPLARDLALLASSVEAKLRQMDATVEALKTKTWEPFVSRAASGPPVTMAQIRSLGLNIQAELAANTSALLEAQKAATTLESMADLTSIALEVPIFALALLLFYRENLQLKKVESELHRAKAAADQANQTKSQFLAHMSHEIRTPLGVMLGYADLLRHDTACEQAPAYADAILRNGQVLLALLNDVLDLAKVEAGRIEVERQPLDVVPFFRELLHNFQIQAEAKKLGLSCSIVGEIPERIVTDRMRFLQVLTNIVSNALKFSQTGSVSLSLNLASGSGGCGAEALLRILITDTGPGIAREHWDRIFVPFAQATTEVQHKFGGTGLGLSLSRNLARALGGDLWLESSEPGRGSTFGFTIDPGDITGVPRLGQGALTCEARPWDEAAPAVKAQLADKAILLVDDFPDNQLMIKALLSHYGASVDLASDGAEGISKARSRHYDLVLMDIQMPVLDGYLAVEQLRQGGYRVPVVALTAHAMKGEWEKCRSAGFDDYLAKPVDRQALIEMAKRFV